MCKFSGGYQGCVADEFLLSTSMMKTMHPAGLLLGLPCLSASFLVPSIAVPVCLSHHTLHLRAAGLCSSTVPGVERKVLMVEKPQFSPFSSFLSPSHSRFPSVYLKLFNLPISQKVREVYKPFHLEEHSDPVSSCVRQTQCKSWGLARGPGTSDLGSCSLNIACPTQRGGH